MADVPSLPPTLAEALEDYIRRLKEICPVGGSARGSVSLTIVTRANGQRTIGLRGSSISGRASYTMKGGDK